MGQLIKVSTTDFKAIHLSSGGKLVPSDQIDQARGRALRLSTIEAQKAGKEDAALQYKVNRQYQRVENNLAYYSAMQAVSAKRTETGTDSLPLTGADTQSPNLYIQGNKQRAAAETLEILESQRAMRQEKTAGYLQDRGAFEMRVHKGDLSFLPAMDMTIVTQMPDIKFEYTGDFIYFPKKPDMGGSIDLES